MCQVSLLAKDHHLFSILRGQNHLTGIAEDIIFLTKKKNKEAFMIYY